MQLAGRDVTKTWNRLEKGPENGKLAALTCSSWRKESE